MILAADDMAYLQVRIVGTGGHVIGRHAVRSEEREILDVDCRFGLVSVDQVSERDLSASLTRDLESHDSLIVAIGVSLRQNLFGSAFMQIEPVALPVEFI